MLPGPDSLLGPLIGLVVLLGPLMALVVAGTKAASRAPRPRWRIALTLAVVSTAVWLIYAGLYQHETPCDNFERVGCKTVYGYGAPLPDGHAAGVVLLVIGFVVPALVVGWRRLAPPLTAGAALAIGPSVLALWTAPRGDNDGLWLLILWLLALLGWMAAGVVAMTERFRAARAGTA